VKSQISENNPDKTRRVLFCADGFPPCYQKHIHQKPKIGMPLLFSFCACGKNTIPQTAKALYRLTNTIGLFSLDVYRWHWGCRQPQKAIRESILWLLLMLTLTFSDRFSTRWALIDFKLENSKKSTSICNVRNPVFWDLGLSERPFHAC